MKTKNKPKYKFGYDIEVLQHIVSMTPVEGKWVFSNNYYQFQIEEKTRLSFYPKTKTMMFQGSDEKSLEFEHQVIAVAKDERTLL